ncbi:hypothetical protein [Variovorax ginsengisoli]|uniref:Uncharacterized protein n=1 Tax=Variovorax ginsengisoli TaxID=363844 RepID=A0ABT8SF68_9BURK|nr:hypothetical protein [Variovorax ginsengisoli]MDN8617848.1 hypothetical protein [Variovorax ginsengisoli]MDO1537018.1 hypothetical protein [Variovorax ginsengisoli]
MRKRTVRRKVWTKDANAFASAISGACIIDDGRLEQLRVRDRAAVEAFRTGTATDQHWRDIADLVNISEVLCEWGVGTQEVAPVLKDVERHLREAIDRYQRTQRMGTTGPGLKAFADLLEYFDLQRTSVGLATYERAVQKVIDRVRSGYTGSKVEPQGATA